MTDISLFDAIRTQRAIRRFTDDPVPDDAIQTILEAATRAPSGANRRPSKVGRTPRLATAGNQAPLSQRARTA